MLLKILESYVFENLKISKSYVFLFIFSFLFIIKFEMSSQQPIIDLTEEPKEFIVSFRAYAHDTRLLYAIVQDVLTAYGIPTEGTVIVQAEEHEEFNRILDDLFCDEGVLTQPNTPQN